MKVVLLAGGFGTRISEESYLKPKPMIEIGEYPILVHIMKIYAANGFNDFIVCAGYKQHIIKQYFNDLSISLNDIVIDFLNNKKEIIDNNKINWNVLVSNTGLNTQTGGRVKRVQKYIGNERFLLTYGDAVSNVDINAVLESHKKAGKLATICVYNFGQSKGIVDVNKDGSVNAFREKSDLDGDLINIGFMVIEPQVFELIDGDSTNFEKDVLTKLAEKGELNAYVHHGFWQCMDTLREKEKLEKMYSSDNCPWKVWKD